MAGKGEAAVVASWTRRRFGWTCSDHAPQCWNLFPLVAVNIGEYAWGFHVGWLRWSWHLGWPRHRRLT